MARGDKLLALCWMLQTTLPVLVQALTGERLYGVNYSLRIGPDWAAGADRCKSYEQIVADLTQLHQQVTDNVRIFSLTDCDTGALLLQATQGVGMGLWLGMWVGANQTNFLEERSRLKQLVGQYDFSNVLGIHVSSEAVYRKDITVAEALDLRGLVKQDMVAAGWENIPITVADIADTYMQSPELISADPLALTANLFPFWEPTVVDINGNSPNSQGINYDSDAEFFAQKFWNVEMQSGSRQVIITETGWADAGVTEGANKATPNSMAKWMRDFVCLAKSKGWQYFWFDAYDSSWRRVNDQRPYDVEGHFGMYDEAGTMKPYLRDLVIDCSAPYWDVDPNDMTFLTTPPTAAMPTTTPPAASSIEITSQPTTISISSPSVSPMTQTPTFPTSSTASSSGSVLLATTMTLVPTASGSTEEAPPTIMANFEQVQTMTPTHILTPMPTLQPTVAPTIRPTASPSTQTPTQQPRTASPTAIPSLVPISPPSPTPTGTPAVLAPSQVQSAPPTKSAMEPTVNLVATDSKPTVSLVATDLEQNGIDNSLVRAVSGATGTYNAFWHLWWSVFVSSFLLFSRPHGR